VITGKELRRRLGKAISKKSADAVARESKLEFCLFSDFFIAIARRFYGDGSTAGSSFNFSFFQFARIERAIVVVRSESESDCLTNLSSQRLKNGA
jgi:hypothetical protein